MRMVIAAVGLAGIVFLLSCSSGSPSSSTASSSSSGSKPRTNDSALAVSKVQQAVDKALDWTRKAGKATVLGVQELPQENAAKADISFDGFRYATDRYGRPISASKQAKPIPEDRLPTPDELFGQPKVEGFSGKGEAILKHYTDGRWVLTGVRFNLVGVNADVEVK